MLKAGAAGPIRSEFRAGISMGSSQPIRDSREKWGLPDCPFVMFELSGLANAEFIGEQIKGGVDMLLAMAGEILPELAGRLTVESRCEEGRAAVVLLLDLPVRDLLPLDMDLELELIGRSCSEFAKLARNIGSGENLQFRGKAEGHLVNVIMDKMQAKLAEALEAGTGDLEELIPAQILYMLLTVRGELTLGAVGVPEDFRQSLEMQNEAALEMVAGINPGFQEALTELRNNPNFGVRVQVDLQIASLNLVVTSR